VGTKAGIKGASVVMGYLETGMRTLDAASSLLSRLQELAVLGANNTNTVQDHEAINLEAEAIADEFHRLMSTSTYKGKDIFTNVAASERVALGGRAAEMSFGIGKVAYTELYDASSERTISYANGPNHNAKFHLTNLPSDGVMSAPQTVTDLELGVTYEITDTNTLDNNSKATIVSKSNLTDISQVVNGARFTVTTELVSSNNGITDGQGTPAYHNFTGRLISSPTGTTFKTLQKGVTYQLTDLATGGTALGDDEKDKIVANSDLTSRDQIVAGVKFTMTKSFDTENNADGINGKELIGTIVPASNVLTYKIEQVQAKINTARVQAGSQYAAIESSVAYTTDLTAQYELGYNTVSDVNFSMETAHLAKNQILQQAATAMLAQANQGQSSLLQLIQG
jgi:flagellin